MIRTTSHVRVALINPGHCRVRQMCAYKQLGKGPRYLLVSKRIDERSVLVIKPSRF